MADQSLNEAETLARISRHTGKTGDSVFGGADFLVCHKGRVFRGRQECLPHRDEKCLPNRGEKRGFFPSLTLLGFSAKRTYTPYLRSAKGLAQAATN